MFFFSYLTNFASASFASSSERNGTLKLKYLLYRVLNFFKKKKKIKFTPENLAGLNWDQVHILLQHFDHLDYKKCRLCFDFKKNILTVDILAITRYRDCSVFRNI